MSRRERTPPQVFYTIMISPDNAQYRIIRRRIENSKAQTIHHALLDIWSSLGGRPGWRQCYPGWRRVDLVFPHSGQPPWDCYDGEAVRLALTGGA